VESNKLHTKYVLRIVMVMVLTVIVVN